MSTWQTWVVESKKVHLCRVEKCISLERLENISTSAVIKGSAIGWRVVRLVRVVKLYVDSWRPDKCISLGRLKTCYTRKFPVLSSMSLDRHATHEYTSFYTRYTNINPWAQTSTLHTNIPRSFFRDKTSTLHTNIPRSFIHETKTSTLHTNIPRSFIHETKTSTLHTNMPRSFIHETKNKHATH